MYIKSGCTVIPANNTSLTISTYVAYLLSDTPSSNPTVKRTAIHPQVILLVFTFIHSSLTIRHILLHLHHDLHNIGGGPLQFLNPAWYSSRRPRCSAHHPKRFALTFISTLLPMVNRHNPLKLSISSLSPFMCNGIITPTFTFSSLVKYILHHTHHSPFHFLKGILQKLYPPLALNLSGPLSPT